MARYSTNDNAVQVTRKTTTQVFKTPGSQTWTVPTGVTCATFELVGGGGGGGARCCCDCYHQGMGGSAGNYVAMTIPVTPGDTYTLCVPYGGRVADIGTEGSHYCCFGGNGDPAYVIGPNITTLCAGGGSGGTNMCYTYCNCSFCCGTNNSHDVCSVSSASSVLVSCTAKIQNYCNEAVAGTTAGGCHYSAGWNGPYTDAQAYYYPTVAGGRSFGTGKVTVNEWCCTKWNQCTSCGISGGAGNGAYSFDCNCQQAGTGRNGSILVRY
jgi:hypothetical protein